MELVYLFQEITCLLVHKKKRYFFLKEIREVMIAGERSRFLPRANHKILIMYLVM